MESLFRDRLGQLREIALRGQQRQQMAHVLRGLLRVLAPHDLLPHRNPLRLRLGKMFLGGFENKDMHPCPAYAEDGRKDKPWNEGHIGFEALSGNCGHLAIGWAPGPGRSLR